MNYRRLAGIIVIFAITIATYVGLYMQTIPNSTAPVARQGILDLSSWDFTQGRIVNLDGEWEFYRNTLLEPNDLQAVLEEKQEYKVIPGTWKGQDEDDMSKHGYATYRLKVLLPDNLSSSVLGMKINSIRMSHLLYVNGELLGESGRPASVQGMSEPGNTPYSTYFHTDKSEIEIVIQMANYVFIEGGLNTIQFGLSQDISMQDSVKIAIDTAAVLLLGMFGAYHLSVFFLRGKEKLHLYAGLYLLSLLMSQLVFGEKILLRFVPDIPFDIAYRMQDGGLIASSIACLLFFCSVDPRIMSFKVRMAWIIPIALYLVAIFVLPYRIYNAPKYLFFIYLGIMIVHIFTRLVYLSVRKQDAAERKEWLLFIGASVALSVFMIQGLLYYMNLQQTDLLSKLGAICFVTLVNLLLAVRFTNAYEKSEKLAHELLVSNQLKDEFLTQTSHEIKTPLHGIMNMTAHLLENDESNLTAGQRQNLWLVKDTAVKLSMLIHDLIDVTRLKHGDLRLEETFVDVRVVTQIVFDVLQFELLGKKVTLDNQVGPGVRVLADENRLRQVMYNLVHNAIKHTEQGFIRVVSRVGLEQVTIVVQDTGIGIPRESYEPIFEYFEHRVPPSKEDGYSGMGVGLYISRKLIERMDGTIGVEWSEVGKGTHMAFTLPHAVTHNAYEEVAAVIAEQSERIPQEQPGIEILDKQRPTVLIVDDEASNIYIMGQILSRHHYNVLTAYSAKDALRKMKEHKYVDLAILDVMMPEMSGFELCRTLRKYHSILDLPILIATVKDTTQDVSHAFKVGANDFVTKPFDADTLIARIQTLIAMKSSIQEAMRNEQAFHQAQIKPHFLYNALSSVISFCYSDGEKAAYLLSMLSQYLRYILDMDRSIMFVPLSQEMELIKAYVEIEKARFRDRFEFICDVDEELLLRYIPPLSIQPFVENAIRHGLFDRGGYGKILLKIHESEDSLEVIVEDDGVGISKEIVESLMMGEQIGGIAIANIRKRLKALSDASFTISSKPGIGTKVSMRLPIMTNEMNIRVQQQYEGMNADV
ncbi:response regulator [Paenibacillus albiflavus]|uniref:histidine kinase n=1 Tax=Paenibacillus albiflavus TaxID=2545760 RepID=A0A4R4E3G1_9BACL|nr:ATP-binding protein [Paenibacillus albiflavus]TCZ74046.1 response regulator [Paenibacillus albiflavus]